MSIKSLAHELIDEMLNPLSEVMKDIEIASKIKRGVVIKVVKSPREKRSDHVGDVIWSPPGGPPNYGTMILDRNGGGGPPSLFLKPGEIVKFRVTNKRTYVPPQYQEAYDIEGVVIDSSRFSLIDEKVILSVGTP